jgi:hypothetical protein
VWSIVDRDCHLGLGCRFLIRDRQPRRAERIYLKRMQPDKSRTRARTGT